MSDQAIVDLSGDTTTIENAHIVQSTRDGYVHSLAHFLVYLFDHSHARIKTDALERLGLEDAKDKKLPTEKQRNARKNLINGAKEELRKMKRTADGATCPVMLQSLQYEDIVGFMNTKKKKVTVAYELANVTGSEASRSVDALVRCSDSTYSGITSAIAFLYAESNNTMPVALKANISRYVKGSKRHGRRLKQDLGLKLTEGKSPISKRVYEKTAEYLFKSEKKEHIFAHMFLILDW